MNNFKKISFLFSFLNTENGYVELRLPRRPCKMKANWNFIFIGPVYEDPVGIKRKIESFQKLNVEMARFSGGKKVGNIF